ncbi:glycosyltransferase involved in cell wall biosynthesis [Flavobacterium sp. PL11]|jgi:glycosyltransferase involved in cell wall biosynthesis|uniref:glycosyltransferase n=1 Tax=Flavobacterium sp. PL11 TaxID=3071717 RepID=UPI002E025A27|nr:glycosyltransferase involved in cell wall biosynthesis [Flavobacterium sp. PL11]
MIKDTKKTNYKITDKRLNTTSPATYEMVVFCHLRWQFVYQRPQHIISRIAKHTKVLMIEEPLGRGIEEEDSANLIIINNNLHVLQPKVLSIEAIASLLPQYLKNSSVAIGWFYSASFSPLLYAVNFDTIIYDCMDELSLFKGAPEKLILQEKMLIAHADIVFTGGKSLYESKKQMHHNVHCFPSSVDKSHFAKALNGIEIPADVAHLKGPVVGYFGVIDERINLKLLNDTALLLPHIEFVMIGPLAKIEECDLPREKNIHYLGMRSYNILPAYLKVFDIAMMPFALNDSTKYISPTKTLEYMASEKPIISTKITDVVRDYSNCVRLIDTADDFAKNISFILEKNDRAFMRKEYKNILRNTSWDTTVDKMQFIINTFAK